MGELASILSKICPLVIIFVLASQFHVYLLYLGACLALRKGSFIQANLQHLILTAQVQIPADGDCKWLIERRIAPGTC